LLKPIVPAIALAAASVFISAPAFAANHVIFQKSNKYATGVPVMVGLVPGHSYRVNIGSPTKRSFIATGYENYAYIANKAMFQKTAGVVKKGTTPASFVLKQPRSGKLSQWILGLQVQITRGRGLSVKITDLGASH
jgi:hypothetical protein